VKWGASLRLTAISNPRPDASKSYPDPAKNSLNDGNRLLPLFEFFTLPSELDTQAAAAWRVFMGN